MYAYLIEAFDAAPHPWNDRFRNVRYWNRQSMRGGREGRVSSTGVVVASWVRGSSIGR